MSSQTVITVTQKLVSHGGGSETSEQTVGRGGRWGRRSVWWEERHRGNDNNETDKVSRGSTNVPSGETRISQKETDVTDFTRGRVSEIE